MDAVLAVLLLLMERLAWALAGACVGLAVEWRWHLCDRLLTWLEQRRWTG